MNECPICGAAPPVTSVTRRLLPSMQNVVFRTPEAARASSRGRFSLATCVSCGFSWNAAFDPSTLTYETGYDNTVPSAVMDRHYVDVAAMLGQRHALRRGYVVDIGCGNGRFLKTLCEVWPDCRAVGVDPALPHDEVLAGGRLTLIKGVFSPEHLEDRPSLLVSRHVLEHMPMPNAFLRELRSALGDRVGVPLFAEVPDLTWILDQRAFWDFCYEHCNYFTEDSLAAVLGCAGFAPTDTGVVFGRQYRWMEGTSASTTPPAGTGAPIASRLSAYATGEEGRVRAIRDRLGSLRDAGHGIVVWGMATKGIMFTLMVDPDSTLIDYTVDVNVNKQGGYVPISGRRIDAPASLRAESGRALVVVVMNPNYFDEIAALCRRLGVRAAFLDASGVQLVAA